MASHRPSTRPSSSREAPTLVKGSGEVLMAARVVAFAVKAGRGQRAAQQRRKQRHHVAVGAKYASREGGAGRDADDGMHHIPE